MFEDKTLVCKDCGKEFVWTAGEQEFYASRGFENQPQRCKACRDPHHSHLFPSKASVFTPPFLGILSLSAFNALVTRHSVSSDFGS